MFLNHQRYNSIAAALFGRTRGQISYRVSNGPAFPTNYTTGQDVIRIGPNSAWGRNGVVIVVHEYGHAFHYVAIDPWVANSFSCQSPYHVPNLPYTTSCAYVEGFADFFAARVINEVDGVQSFGDGLNQSILEQNDARSAGNGLLIEATMAALFLDLVDDASAIDGLLADDDTLHMSLYDLTQIMRTCRMTTPSTALLTHSDQFVYCAAGSVSERNFAPSFSINFWGVYSGHSYDTYTILPTQSAFRALWRKNLYDL